MHNHDADSEACLNRKILYNSVKIKQWRTCVKDPRRLTHKELRSQYFDTVTYKDVRNISRNRHKACFSQLFLLPNVIEETHEALSSVQVTSIYQPTNAHIISHKTLLKHFKTLRHVSILSDHHQGDLFVAKFILQYSQFNSYLQTRCKSCTSCTNCTSLQAVQALPAVQVVQAVPVLTI